MRKPQRGKILFGLFDSILDIKESFDALIASAGVFGSDHNLGILNLYGVISVACGDLYALSSQARLGAEPTMISAAGPGRSSLITLNSIP